MPNDMSLNRQSKNSVFVNFFKDVKNVLRMYQELHPEATDVTVDDIKIDTLESVIVNTLYNDLGFRVKDKYIFLAEAQSDWNENNYLSDFMKFHEKEVIGMMYELFDEETMRKQLDTARSRRDVEKNKG